MTSGSMKAGGLLMAAILLSGCAAANLVGAMGQAHEYQKLVDTPPKYDGLQNKTVAVLVQADMSTLYEHPDLTVKIAEGVSGRLQRDVPGAMVLNPKYVIDWQYRTPQWASLPVGEMAEQLNVDRIVHIELLEYRLNPPGNRWLWEGVCVGRVGVVERGGIDPDIFTETFDISAKFPTISGVGADTTPRANIEYGLLHAFIERTAWLFHQHLEPKYPDKYRPELDAKRKKSA